MTDMDSALSQAARSAEAASNTKALDVVARWGFAVMALLHVVVGAIAIAVAFGQPGEPEPTGAIEQLAANQWGPFVMWSCAAGCAGLALWQLSEATLRVRRERRRERLGKLISSGSLTVVYGSVGYTFASFAVGARSDSGESTRAFSTSLLSRPLGAPVLVIVGLIIIGIGIYFVFKGFAKRFKDELQHFEGTRRGRAISGLGVAGHVAKGVALKLVGLLFIVAAVKNNAAESTGLDGSLKALQDHPWGPLLLTAIGAGFICYGVFALIRSRFGRM